MHDEEQFLQQKHDLSSKGFLTVEYMGKREQLPVNTKGSQVSPRLPEVVVKQLDPRWARQGATTALLKAAGYGTDVAVKTEYAGDLPAHLSCWSSHFLFFLGGRAIHYTYMDMQRKKPQVSNGRPSTAEAASYPHYLGRGRHKSLQGGNMSGKTSSPQGSCSPAHSQACSLSTNKASPLSEFTQHSCQDHKCI